MKKNSTSQSAFLVPRILLGLLFLMIGISLAVVGFGQSGLNDTHSNGVVVTDSPDVTPTPTPTPTATPAMTLTIRSTADTGETTFGAGCTLRQAVNASNANPPPMGTTNLIAFNIPSNDPGCNPSTNICTITLTDCLGRSG